MAIRSDGVYQDPPQASQKKYDYLIAGGGVAGLVLAARLTEDASKTVLVIEAGENRMNDDNIKIPGLIGTLWGNADYDWKFWSEPQVRSKFATPCLSYGSTNS